MSDNLRSEKATLVKVLAKVAGKYGVESVSPKAGRGKVAVMVDKVLACPTLTIADRDSITETRSSLEKLYKRRRGDDAAPAPAKEQKLSWKLSAVQLIYNCTSDEWCSKDKDVLKALFNRFVEFAKALAKGLGAKGISVTMEESLEAGEHVHFHVYMHLAKPFRTGSVKR